MKTIRSQKLCLGSYEINKVSFSCFDDKRYIHHNGISSYVYGHYRYPYRGEDIDLFHFTQISVSILWRRYTIIILYFPLKCLAL